jgi:hypothetical protein
VEKIILWMLSCCRRSLWPLNCNLASGVLPSPDAISAGNDSISHCSPAFTEIQTICIGEGIAALTAPI